MTNALNGFNGGSADTALESCNSAPTDGRPAAWPTSQLLGGLKPASDLGCLREIEGL